ncbi:MAG: hypothetical protein HZC43_00660 [Nitrosomonadales bacterium]|nr:hypothetical protein [Nitrosomonadales bacterium]
MEDDKDDDKKKKVVELFKKNAKPKSKPRKPAAPVGNVIHVNGDGAVVGQIAGGDIHNHHNEKPPRPRVVVAPGPDVISEAQKVALLNLRGEWIAVHDSVKQKKLSIAAAQGRINKQAGVTSYHLIKAAVYDSLVKWIKQQIALVHAMPSAPVKSTVWRSSRIKGIQSRCNELGIQDKRKAYMLKTFGKDSLTLLSDDDVEKVYRWAMGKH